MVKDISATKAQPLYVKVGNFTGLYRNTVSGGYYGYKKLRGKRKEVSLRTTDRKIAERRLREWMRNLILVNRDLERTTLGELVQKFVAINRGKSAKTQSTDRCIIRQMERNFPCGMNVEVRQVRTSHLEEWLALHENRLKNTTYNRYAGLLKQIFDIAVRDRIIAESPFAQVRTQWKRPQPPVRLVPTEEQFHAIVECVRSQPLTDHAKESADFIEFLGLAGLGQAEAGSVTWGDVDWKNGRISMRRRKTGVRFYIPIYPDLKPFLQRRRREADDSSRSAHIFAIKDAKKGLQAACDRLGVPKFSQRSIRRCLIRRLWRAGVDKKLIAKWQGHQDGGQLIIDTYTEVFGDDDAEYEQQQLAKLCLR